WRWSASSWSCIWLACSAAFAGWTFGPFARTPESRMSIRAWRFATLLFAALSLTMESAHVLELPQKLRYDAVMYAAVNTTLYRGFAIVGGIYQLGSIILALVLTVLVRRRGPSFGWTL